MDLLWGFFVFMLVVVGAGLQIAWALRVMRALESSARSADAGAAHLDAMRNAIIVIGRQLRGEPDPPPARPRQSPRI